MQSMSAVNTYKHYNDSYSNKKKTSIADATTPQPEGIREAP